MSAAAMSITDAVQRCCEMLDRLLRVDAIVPSYIVKFRNLFAIIIIPILITILIQCSEATSRHEAKMSSALINGCAQKTAQTILSALLLEDGYPLDIDLLYMYIIVLSSERRL